ncbi:PI-PLC X domain-containing protein 2 isoform X2 [Bacillus rossius redtenbacheri]|uniref:PI-PLC X domain-containing protein 2 isoform X2 n=1 Tax=Bacillus rossius redtenbacheri TaxID=93214 RepID=UPI002FDEE832
MGDMGDTADLAADTENWMGRLPEALRAVPLIHLAIPGSHDSGSCTITPDAAVSPDSLPVVRRLAAVFCRLVKRCIYRWSVTQRLSVTQQLAHGIRYLDLRVSSKPEQKELYVVHGMYGAPVSGVLEEVNSFLLQRPNEAVILDLQHFYQMTPEHHSALLALVVRTFGPRLCPVVRSLEEVTLSWLRARGFQVIVVYRSAAARGDPSFWPAGSWPTPWPDTTSVPAMLAFLEDKMAARPANCGLVTQCVLTPDVRWVQE